MHNMLGINAHTFVHLPQSLYLTKTKFCGDILRPLKNTNIVIASDTRRKRLRCASEAISQDVDKPRDCHVALLLAMTEPAILQRSHIIMKNRR